MLPKGSTLCYIIAWYCVFIAFYDMWSVMKEQFDAFRANLFKKPFIKRLLLMLLGVELMGVCVAVLKLTHFGTDPYAATCYGLSKLTGISFGTMELLFNGILFFIVIFFDMKRLGFGTIGNMVLVGYTADLTTYTIGRMGIETIDSMLIRVIVMIIAISIFIVAVALYIDVGLGASPYDVIPYIIHNGACHLIHKDIPFRYFRMAFDAFFTLIGFILGGESGVITVLMVLFLGTVIEKVSLLLEVKLGLKGYE